MSDKYILRSGAIDAIKRNAGTLYTREAEFLLQKVIFLLKNAPAADVAEVVYGRWIRPHWKNNNYCCDCSECGGEAMHRDYQWDKNGVYPICPHCGTKMDRGVDHA